MADNDDTMYKDLVGFLSSSRSDLKEAATEAALTAVTDHRTENEAIRSLVKYGAVPHLCRCLAVPGKTGRDALATLLVMTFASSSSPSPSPHCEVVDNESESESDPVEAILDANGISRVTELVLTLRPQSAGTEQDEAVVQTHLYRAVALLANLTRNERGAAGFLTGRTIRSRPNDEEEETTELSPAVTLLLARFLTTGPKLDRNDDNNVVGDPFRDPEEDNDGVEAHLVLNDDEALARTDPYLHFASVLTNVTQINAGRNFVTNLHAHLPSDIGIHGTDDENECDDPTKQKKRTPVLPPIMAVLLSELRSSPSVVRRRGVARTIKNCCFDTAVTKLWLAPLRHGVVSSSRLTTFGYGLEDDLVVGLLIPLLGPVDEYDDPEGDMLDPLLLELCRYGCGVSDDYGFAAGNQRRREPDPVVRRTLVETLLLLCASGRASREVIRSKGAYAVLRQTDLAEDDETVGDLVQECVQFLKRDEEGSTEEGESERVAAALARARRQKLLAADYDGVD